MVISQLMIVRDVARESERTPFSQCLTLPENAGLDRARTVPPTGRAVHAFFIRSLAPSVRNAQKSAASSKKEAHNEA
jgi:hypothetical protein